MPTEPNLNDEAIPTEYSDATAPDQTASSPKLGRAVYRSAVDLWLAVILALPIVGAIILGAVLILMERPGDASWMFLTAAVILIVTAIFTVPCRYTLLEDTLSIRCGVLCCQVTYESIGDLEKSRTLRSGMAMSLNRIVIHTDRKDHIISPVNRDRFIDDLKKRIAACRSSATC